MAEMDRIFVYETKLAPSGCLPLSRGQIHVYDVHTQNISETACSWPPKPPKYFSVGIFEYILASMPNVYLNV